MMRVLDGMFNPPELPVRPSDAILWWEQRRIPFNVVVGAYGICCLAVFLVALGTSGHLQPGEDAIEPLALIAAPFAINALYTLGWLVEAPIRFAVPDSWALLGPTLLKMGLGFGGVLITLPAAVWGGYRVMQLLGLTQ